MKKTGIIVVFFVLLLITSVYWLIPARIPVASSTLVNLPDVTLQRVLVDESDWSRWWYNAPEDTAKGYIQNGYQFTLTQKYYKAIQVAVKKEHTNIQARLNIVPFSVDSSGLEWKCELPAGIFPWERILSYYQARSIKQALDEISGKMKSFFSNTKNVYGLTIERNRLMDTLYVSNKKLFGSRPGQKEIYDLIHSIKTWVTAKGAPVTGNPIYNISQLDDTHFQLMAAVPTDRRLPETDGYAMKYMVKGSFMISEVVGGEATVSHAWKQMMQYFEDYRKTSMAMNFTMLVTDRTLQTDSSKWITKLYMPVF
jgi:hypothetical protein